MYSRTVRISILSRSLKWKPGSRNCACVRGVVVPSRTLTLDQSDTGRSVKPSRWQVKRCKACGLDKSLDEFSNDLTRRGGKYPYCKQCAAQKKRESNVRLREKDPEAYIDKWRGYRETYKQRNPERQRHHERRQNLKSNFGLTIDQYEEMSQLQGGVCAICLSAPIKKALAVDHNHTTGKIRGLLCGGCNMALGQLETEDRLSRAIEYIMRFQ